MEFDFIDLKYIDDLYLIWSDKETIKYTNIETPCTYKECKERINIFLNNQIKLEDKTVFVVIEDGIVCGTVGCPIINDETREFGFFYQINRSYWNKGIGYKSARMMIDYMNEKYPGCVLWADVVEQNTASVKILNRLGFNIVKRNENSFDINGKKYDVIEFSKYIR